MITAKRFRTLCLSLADAEEAPHMERTAFRVRKIFATLPPDGRSANLLLVPELQAAVLDALPHAFSPVPGGWGRMGYTTVDLTRASEDELVPVLREAHALASEPPKKKASTARRSSTTRTSSAASKASIAKKTSTPEMTSKKTSKKSSTKARSR
ncbi:MAG: MmcQ/YjbR family DNA-binding protein [Deltaproteobacteria bacterium]|nr:MmcQ/YjbR family DNA-binding protein [Deltaproteobacteria bacterium]